MSVHPTRARSLIPIVALLAALLSLALIAAACGDSSTESGDGAESPAAAASSAASPATATVAEYTAYYGQMKPVYEQVTAALSSLDGSVKNLSKTPDKSWTKSAKQMSSAAEQFGEAATTLEGVTPPAPLASVQSDVISALQDAQKVLEDTAAYLDKRVADPDMPDVKTTIEQEVKAKLTTVLQSAVAEVMAGLSGGSAPPSTAP
jgi:hypothetical protein